MASILEKDVKYLDEQYRIGNAIISDEAFDHLERNLLKTDPRCNYFNQKGNLKLPSIKKTNYKKFLGTLLKNTRLSIQPKIDGCAIGIQYINGKFSKAITRKGSDVTNRVKKIQNVPHYLPIKRNFQVRGELYAPNQSPSISQRNTSRFLENNKELAENFNFCCFQILNGRLNEYETLNYLKKCGFNTPHSYYTNFTSQVESFRKEWIKGKLFSNYPTDGIIIKINSRKLQYLRETNYFKRQEWQYAIKN
tara:strand:+ start:8939 stop:9688 length:750 start_codon:yes stop_codon:yes gene_type:complete